jgi:hypothetical protein
MPQVIRNYAANKDELAVLLANGFKKGSTGTIGLLKSGGTYGADMTLADVLMNEPTNVEMPGYAPITPVVWSAEYRGAGGASLVDTGLLGWTLTSDASAPVTIVGAYFTDATNVEVFLLDAPQQVQEKDERISLAYPFGYV